jgi:hypothetical protein
MSDDTRPDIPALPDAAAIARYMRAAGWDAEVPHGTVFTKGPAKIAVPHEDHDPDAVRMALYRLAVAEGRTVDEMAATVLSGTRRCGWCRDPYCTGDHSGDATPDPWPADAARDILAGPQGHARGRAGTGEDQAMAQAVCEHFYASHCYRGLYVRLCTLCHEPDWDDLERQQRESVAERERAERAEAKLAAVAGYVRSRPSWVTDPVESRLRKDAILAIVGSDEAGKPAPLSAVCTGPDCGEQFADSETSEYLFATRERMEKLLDADGWTADPVLCPACQPDGAA